MRPFINIHDLDYKIRLCCLAIAPSTIQIQIDALASSKICLVLLDASKTVFQTAWTAWLSLRWSFPGFGFIIISETFQESGTWFKRNNALITVVNLASTFLYRFFKISFGRSSVPGFRWNQVLRCSAKVSVFFWLLSGPVTVVNVSAGVCVMCGFRHIIALHSEDPVDQSPVRFFRKLFKVSFLIFLISLGSWLVALFNTDLSCSALVCCQRRINLHFSAILSWIFFGKFTPSGLLLMRVHLEWTWWIYTLLVRVDQLSGTHSLMLFSIKR